jgi:thiol-disulfide isomerase/thioredoxin
MSCRQSALSNGIEAFISRMIAEGPPAKRPPHIALEPLFVVLSRSLKLVALGCALLLGGCDRESGDQAQPPATQTPSAQAAAQPVQAGAIDRSHRGSALPDFQLKNAAGLELNLAALKGQPLLINLWATWCAPCVAELPQLNRLAAERSGSLKVLTVNQDMDKLGKVAPFLAARGGAQLEPWLNPDNSLTFQFGAETLPATIYYDAGGREVWRVIGGRDWSGADTAALLAEAK